MKRILIHSPAFFPAVGGLEYMARMLAEEFVRQGSEVRVVTTTPAGTDQPFEFPVFRRPSWRQHLRLVRWADAVLHMNISLRGLWPLLFLRRPLVVSHQGPYRRASGRTGLRDHMKYWVAQRAINIACSAAVRRHLPSETCVIWNAYDDAAFRHIVCERPLELVFVGRLVSDKGVDLLLHALVELRAAGLTPRLTVVGEGPEEPALRALCQANGLGNQAQFAGVRTGDDLVTLIARHRVMVVPSRREPFGIVALEGIACGCAVVASDADGLPEAVGPCGMTFPAGIAKRLADALQRVLTDPQTVAAMQASRDAHLARFTPREVARKYLAVIEGAASRAGRW